MLHHVMTNNANCQLIFWDYFEHLSIERMPKIIEHAGVLKSEHSPAYLIAISCQQKHRLARKLHSCSGNRTDRSGMSALTSGARSAQTIVKVPVVLIRV